MCVAKCPDKFATYADMQLQHKLNKSHWEYYRQFCKPDFNNLDKVPKLIYVSHQLFRNMNKLHRDYYWTLWGLISCGQIEPVMHSTNYSTTILWQ